MHLLNYDEADSRFSPYFYGRFWGVRMLPEQQLFNANF